MTPLSIALGCVFLQVGLTFWAIYRMGSVRVASLKAREVSLGDIALETSKYPSRVRQFQNNAHNQFETPILLYVLVLLAAAMDAANWGVAIAVVAFMVSRFWHRSIHVSSNDVRIRFKVYLLGLMALLIGWVSLGLGLLGVW